MVSKCTPWLIRCFSAHGCFGACPSSLIPTSSVSVVVGRSVVGSWLPQAPAWLEQISSFVSTSYHSRVQQLLRRISLVSIGCESLLRIVSKLVPRRRNIFHSRSTAGTFHVAMTLPVESSPLLKQNGLLRGCDIVRASPSGERRQRTP